MNVLCARSLLAILFAVGLASAAECQARAFKGWELYSWMDGPEWRFSLLVGTNRLKFCSEIRNPRGALTLDQVERELSALAPVEHVFWHGSSFGMSRDDCGTAYPPAEIVARIRALCRRFELSLSDSASPAAGDRR